MDHGRLRAWLIALARPACRRRRDRLVDFLWAQGSGRKDERAFSDVSATSGPLYAAAEFPSPSRFSRSVEINGAGEIVLRSVFQMINDWNYNPLSLYYA